jgi:hypothetical protein
MGHVTLMCMLRRVALRTIATRMQSCAARGVWALARGPPVGGALGRAERGGRGRLAFAVAAGVPVSVAAGGVTPATAKGSVLTASGTTGFDGSALFTYKVDTVAHGVGAYALWADASAAGYGPGGGTTSFQVTP